MNRKQRRDLEKQLFRATKGAKNPESKKRFSREERHIFAKYMASLQKDKPVSTENPAEVIQ